MFIDVDDYLLKKKKINHSNWNRAHLWKAGMLNGKGKRWRYCFPLAERGWWLWNWLGMESLYRHSLPSAGMSVQLFQSLRCAKKPQFYRLSSTLITFDSAGHAFHGRDEQVFEQFAGWNAATTKSWSPGSSRAREGAQQQDIGSNLPIHSAKAELWAGQKPLQVYFCTQRCTYLCEIAVIWRMRRKLSDGDGITSKLTRWLLDWPCLNIAKIHTLFSCKKIRIQVKRSLRWCASNKKDDQSQVKSEEVVPSCHV